MAQRGRHAGVHFGPSGRDRRSSAAAPGRVHPEVAGAGGEPGPARGLAARGGPGVATAGRRGSGCGPWPRAAGSPLQAQTGPAWCGARDRPRCRSGPESRALPCSCPAVRSGRGEPQWGSWEPPGSPAEAPPSLPCLVSGFPVFVFICLCVWMSNLGRAERGWAGRLGSVTALAVRAASPGASVCVRPCSAS